MPWAWWTSLTNFMEIFQAVKKLILWARLNFRRRPILCTTEYSNPMQASNFGGTFDQLYLWIFFMRFSRKMLLNFFRTMVQKESKNDQKLKSKEKSKEKLIRLSKRGVRAIFRAPPWTPSLPLYQQLQICRLPQRMDYKLLVFTYRCTHSLTSTLLTNEFSVLGQSNACTRSITRGQSFISLSLPNVCHRSGTISPLFTCSLLWNSLPSSLRHPDVKFSRFRNALATYMGFPVTRHT